MKTIAPHDPAARELFDEMRRWPIFDPHSHIDPHRPAARNLDEVLGYHYYTELAHSSGMPAERVAPDLPTHERVRHLAENLDRFDNTVQYSWLLEIARTFHDFPHDRIGPDTIGDLEVTGRSGAGRGRLGPRGLDEDQARGGLPDQRIRRPARRLGHEPVRPVPADR